MARYNHFSKKKYKSIPFDSLQINDLFRKDFFKNGKRRKDVVCQKTGDLSYREKRSEVEATLLDSKIFLVSSYNKAVSATD